MKEREGCIFIFLSATGALIFSIILGYLIHAGWVLFDRYPLF
jgi:hypothetical protein